MPKAWPHGSPGPRPTRLADAWTTWERTDKTPLRNSYGRRQKPGLERRERAYARHRESRCRTRKSAPGAHDQKTPEDGSRKEGTRSRRACEPDRLLRTEPMPQ